MNGIKQKSRRRRQKKRVQRHKRSVLAISSVILLLLVTVSVNGITLRAKEKSYVAQETELKKQIKEEKSRASKIDELEDYVGTDEYVEDVAREKLGLVHEGEIIFKAK
ncbi:hypothetical protein CE91St62_01300 [Lachnospiraceae bacterium]|uniref:FtsB family cell division protein n=1 Tax=Extibacter sp. GGCC_0201 TaxID=2731209 RepID=UPI001AA1AFE5|nr:septum formation initiator family protein [Extibacter sp. GGCC_0201]MBO1720886.1 septum formation initiator family protein [Extibacter sp. GGCC_0201]BDF32056.1 hypothetical protein CE91St61_01310 [Lachnospiraceae bacterium]BDF36069.1 hypothetical protein CE91St62_01300 [Lachnospiraceae bacterium]